jgi:hypothetical protein
MDASKKSNPEDLKDAIHEAALSRSPGGRLALLEERGEYPAAPELAGDPDLLERFMAHLERSVKRDRAAAMAVFLTGLSAFGDEPLNLFLRGPSSIGKTYVTVKALQYFPRDRVLWLGGLSPTALIHDQSVVVDGDSGEAFDPFEGPQQDDFRDSEGKLDKGALREAKREWRQKLKKAVYLVDLTGKILVFLEAPHLETFARLRPILSHDVPEISYKFADRVGGGPLQTMHVKIRGWPATVFCTTAESFVEDLATRSFTFTPTMNPEKYQEVIELEGSRAANPWLHADDAEARALREYVAYLSVRSLPEVVIPFAEQLARAYGATQPRDMRDYQHLQALIKTSTLLNVGKRPVLHVGPRRVLLASLQDLESAMEVFSAVEATTRAGLAGHVTSFYYEVLLPLWEERKQPLTYKELAQAHNERSAVKIASKAVGNYCHALQDIGWVDLEQGEVDRRTVTITPIINPNNLPHYSNGIIYSLFSELDFRNWLIDLKKYSTEKTLLQRCESEEPQPVEVEGVAGTIDDRLLESIFAVEYFPRVKNPVKSSVSPETPETIPLEESGVIPMSSETVEQPTLGEALKLIVEKADEMTRKVGGPVPKEDLRSALSWDLEFFDRVLKQAVRDRLLYETPDDRIGVNW